jgi:hypothetical protein
MFGGIFQLFKKFSVLFQPHTSQHWPQKMRSLKNSASPRRRDGITWLKSDAFTKLTFTNNLQLRIVDISGLADSGSTSVRVFIPRKRFKSNALQWPKGTFILGAKTLLEGGSMGDFTRQQIESFCMTHNVEVDVRDEVDGFVLEIRSLSTVAPAGETSSFESALQVYSGILYDCDVLTHQVQVLCGIVEKFNWEKDAYERAMNEAVSSIKDAEIEIESVVRQRILNDLFGPENGYFMMCSVLPYFFRFW